MATIQYLGEQNFSEYDGDDHHHGVDDDDDGGDDDDPHDHLRTTCAVSRRSNTS